MAINITTLFTNLGKVFYTHEVSETHVDAIPTQFAAVETAYEASGDLDLITGLPNLQNTYIGNSETLAQSLADIASNTIITVVNADNPQPNTEFLTAYDELVRQMNANVPADTVEKNVVGGSITAGTNTGTGIFNYSLKDKYGVTNENIFPENVVIACTSDAQTGGQTIGNEAFTAAGEFEISNILSANWPTKGSASSVAINAISATGDNAYGNLLTNSYFLSATTNWTLSTAVINNSVTPYYGINTLHSTGNGTAIQVFDDSTNGTAGALYPNTQYSLSYWTKGVGTVTISIDNGTSTINDSAGTANSFAQAVNSAATWVNYKTTFRTPAILPAITRLKIAFTLVTGDIAVDFISLGAMTEVYTNGPSLAIHSGASQFYLGDSAILATTNTYAGEFQTYFNRFFGLREQNRQLPSAASGAETIADTLIG